MFKPALASLVTVLFLISSVRAEDGDAELERLLSRKTAELELQRLEMLTKFKPDGPEVAAVVQLRQLCLERLKEIHATMRNELDMRLKEIEEAIRAMKQANKNEQDAAQLQMLEQFRAALTRRKPELETGITLPADDGQKTADKKQAQNNNFALHVALGNGKMLEAEGPWLQQVTDQTRDILEQFTDVAKDGVVSVRVPEPFDAETANQIKAELSKLAPKVEVAFIEKARLLTATSDDNAQLRRVAAVLRSLKPNPPGFAFDPNQMKFQKQNDFNPGMNNGQNDGKKAPGGKGDKGDMDGMKKQKDTTNDNF